jgi:predicted component of viral defense system (DUF524 family)
VQSQEAVQVLFSSREAAPALRVYRLPKKRNPRVPELWAVTSTVHANPGEPAFEVVEGCEYRFEWSAMPADQGRGTTEPEELFEPDDLTGRTGRLRPRLSTGTVDALLRIEGATLVSFSFEVRSKKLDYKSEYRWMLRDVAEHMTELVMHRFAASRMVFEVDESRDAETLYEQFEFLRAALQGDRLRQAFARIVQTPHVSWDVSSELVPASRGIKASADATKRLARGGVLRVSITHIPGLSSIPEQVLSTRTEQTVDTVPNRFVLYALEHWEGMLWRLADALARKNESAVVLRARREVRDVIEDLSEMLRAPLFTRVGRLHHFPSANQVLQKREAYRDFYKTFIEFELAAMLTWRTHDTRYRAGQRDVAELYEFWTFLQVGAIVGDLIAKPFLLGPLLTASPDGLAINLRSGQESVVEGGLVRAGRHLHVALYFNRTFGANSAEGHSWTRPMRPDITLSITPSDMHGAEPEPTHIHFDAKYRIQALEEIFGGATEVVDANAGPSDATAAVTVRRDDLLKMHAYRDAIRRTAGAYVLYPGSAGKSEEFREYHELLPGLGAFVLRPTQDGVVSGATAVRTFINQVLDQAALRFTQHERSRHWLSEVYGPERVRGAYLEPPDQASVLLGFVKNKEHWAWIRRTRTYNVRTLPRTGGVPRDSALLQSQLLLLYCPDSGDVELFRIIGEAELASAQAMAQTSYPQPQGDYWCVQISPLGHWEWTEGVTAQAVNKHVMERTGVRGLPTLADWRSVLSLKESASR